MINYENSTATIADSIRYDRKLDKIKHNFYLSRRKKTYAGYYELCILRNIICIKENGGLKK